MFPPLTSSSTLFTERYIKEHLPKVPTSHGRASIEKVHFSELSHPQHRGRARVAKWDRLRTYWLSAFAGSSPAVRIVRGGRFQKSLFLLPAVRISFS